MYIFVFGPYINENNWGTSISLNSGSEEHPALFPGLLLTIIDRCQRWQMVDISHIDMHLRVAESAAAAVIILSECVSKYLTITGHCLLPKWSYLWHIFVLISGVQGAWRKSYQQSTLELPTPIIFVSSLIFQQPGCYCLLIMLRRLLTYK